VRRLAVLSFHTSPLAQPGTGDGGGMNVYVRELSSALARAGVECDVFTRAWSPDVPAVVSVEPGFRVHHVAAGPLAIVPKEELPDLVEEFTDGVRTRMTLGPGDLSYDAIHANYWLSGLAGHRLKHELDLPLVSTFHTLDRVKAESSPEEVSSDEPHRRAEAESAIMACSEVVLASCSVEVDQLVDLYKADPERIRIVPPGVDHAFFAPGYRPQARRAVGLPSQGPLLAFIGRIQPLKGADIALAVLEAILPAHPETTLVLVGGPSGPHGQAHLDALHQRVNEKGLGANVRFVDPQPHELLSSYYRAADVCLVPSRSESFGLVALEAAACGTPVVASAVGGLSTLVEHGSTGFLVDGHDVDGFARAAARLVEEPVMAEKLALNAVDRARQFTWTQAANLLRSTYEELAAEPLVACM
jgi:D-inositol-3-phosphate glycosyltransferase